MIFRAMNTERARIAPPQTSPVGPIGLSLCDGGLFAGSTDVPRFSKIARSYPFTSATSIEKINPDISDR